MGRGRIPLTPIQLLKATRALLTDHYCKGAFAKGQDGKVVYWEEPEAISFCIVGGMRKLNPFAFGSQEHSELHLKTQHRLSLVKSDVIGTSDQGHEQALALLDTAIQWAEDDEEGESH